MPRNIAASKIGNGVISLLWQLRCHCIPDHDKFSSLSNKTVVAIFPNVCLWRRSYAQNWEVLTLKNCYSIEPPSYASAASVVASYGPRFFSTVCFGKILWIFLGKWFTAPPWQKISRTPMNLIDLFTVSVAILVEGKHGKTRVSISWSFRCNKQSLNN